jgi:hypothetical protein
MADSSWDNNGQPMQRKQGMSIWAKVAMGCGLVFLLGLGGCVVLGATCARAIGKTMDGREWSQLKEAVQQLQTDEGAKALYQANPDLWQAYPSEENFLQQARIWRPKLEPLPTEMPSILTGKISYNVHVNGGFRKVELGYTNSRGTAIASRWENGRLHMISVN